jgi:hypothetical protein
MAIFKHQFFSKEMNRNRASPAGSFLSQISYILDFAAEINETMTYFSAVTSLSPLLRLGM